MADYFKYCYGNYYSFNNLLMEATRIGSVSGWEAAITNNGDISGKHYFECEIINKPSGSSITFGVATSDFRGDSYSGLGNAWFLWSDGRPFSTDAGNQPDFCNPDIGGRQMFAYDLTAGKIWIGYNGVYSLSGDPVAGTNPTFTNLAIGKPLYPMLESIFVGGQTGKIYLNPADWLYAPAGFSRPSAGADESIIYNGCAYSYDKEGGGAYCIQGKITEFLVPGQYRVRLYDQQTGRHIRETWSTSTGDYSFANLDAKQKYVVAFDHTTPLQNAAIQDKVVPS